jgi:hypothetical protein
MLCFLCGKKIGFMRSLTDQQYCSNEHRQEARMASAQVMREEEDGETWAVERSRRKGKTAAKPNANSVGQNASILAFVLVGVLLIAAMVLPGPQGGVSSFPNVSADRATKQGILERAGDAMGGFLRSNAPVTLQHDFGAGSISSAAAAVSDWATVNLGTTIGKMDDARSSADSARPSLRLWKRSTTMQNYQMVFQGQLEKSSLSWAVRATDGANYYATKLAILNTAGSNAGIIRYAVVGGKELDKTQLPLGFSLDRGKDYTINVTVQDDKIITYLNGNLISYWNDKRLVRGGVGFFDDSSDPQKVSWVSLSERDSFLGRMLAHFSLLVVPGEPLAFQ